MPEDFVRITIHLPAAERDAFDQWCRYGGKPRLSMTGAAREAFRQLAAGKLALDRKKASAAARKPGPR